MNLFNESAIPVTLKKWSGDTEKAPRHGEKKVVKAVFAVELTPERASDFQPGDGEVKAVVFKAAADGKLRPFLRDSIFVMKLGSQKLTIQTTPDSSATMCFDSVKFNKTVTCKSGSKNAVLLLQATIGPLGRDEYAYLGQWHTTQRFVTFEESAPDLPMEDDGLTDADEKARVVTNDGPVPPAPMWDDDEEQQAADAAREEAATEQGHRYPKKTKAKKGTRK